MVLQALTSSIYSVVQSSWIIAAISLKYILGIQIALAYQDEGAFIKNLEASVSSHSREIISSIVLLGMMVSISGIELAAFMKPASYTIAVAYFGYLFWEF